MMFEPYILSVVVAAALALSACKQQEPVDHPEKPFPNIATLPPIPPASEPASVPTTPASAASTPKQEQDKPKAKVDLLVFDKLNRDCLINAASTKMTPDQCRDKAWKDAQK